MFLEENYTINENPILPLVAAYNLVIIAMFHTTELKTSQTTLPIVTNYYERHFMFSSIFWNSQFDMLTNTQGTYITYASPKCK